MQIRAGRCALKLTGRRLFAVRIRSCGISSFHNLALEEQLCDALLWWS